jgi:hypothetical protein
MKQALMHHKAVLGAGGGGAVDSWGSAATVECHPREERPEAL